MSAGAAWLVVVLALAAIASVRRPFVGVCAIAAIDFLRPQDLYLELVPLRPVVWLAAATLLGTVLARPRGGRQLARALAPLGGVLLIAALSAAASDMPALAWSAWVGLAKSSILIALTVLHVDSPRRLRVILWTIAGSIGVLAVATILHGVALGYPGAYDSKVGGLGGPAGIGDGGPMRDNNAFARVLVFVLPVSIALALWSRRGATRALAAAGALATAIALLFTFSRGGFIACGLIALLAISRVRPRWAAAAILVGVVTLGYSLLPEVYRDRLATVRLDDYSLNLRFGIWREGLVMAAEHPVLGVGVGTFAAHYSRDVPPPARSSHNVFVEVLAEMGVPGLLAYLWLIAAALFPLRRLARDESAGAAEWRIPAWGLLYGSIAYLIASTALSHAFATYFINAIALSLAAAHAARRPTAHVAESRSSAHAVALEGAR